MAKRIKNEVLAKYTTMKIGGPSEIMSIPNNIDDLISEVMYCKEENIPYRILGNGSNLLISDKGIRGFVIKLNKACNSLKLVDKNKIKVGSGVRLQKFIRFAVNNNLGGYELLYSIPGTVGGAIYMNAGIGGKNNVLRCISDYLISVEIFDGKEIVSLTKDKCEFGHRKSIFQKNPEWIILSGLFELPFQEKCIGLKKIKERMKYVMKHQDRRYACAGSIFCDNYSRITSYLMKGRRYGNAAFSQHNGNWINNLGGAKFKDVIFLIKMAQYINCLFSFKKPVLEIKIWK